MKKKLTVLLVVLLAALGGAYKTVLAKPDGHEREPKVQGSVYVLGKEFLVNLRDGRFAKLTVALVLAHDDTSAVAAGGHGPAAKPPEGYGSMSQEAVIRAVVTDDLTDVRAEDVIDRKGRARLQERILKDIRRQSDVKVEHVLFPDVTVQ